MTLNRRGSAIGYIAVIAAAACPACAWAQDGGEGDVAKPGPKYLYLRYDEDFSYLDGADGSYEPDFFDPIKNIHLNEDWRLSIGGGFRFRMESSDNIAYGLNRRTNDTFQLYRLMMHADFKYGDTFRLFAEGILALDEDRDLAWRGGDENQGDIHQLFFDWKVLGADLPLTLRVGRQELNYGHERLVSPLGWASVRRRFDGIKLFAEGDTWDVDVWYAKPVRVERTGSDDWELFHDRNDNRIDFYGLYATYKGIPGHGVDGYFLAIDDTGNAMNPNGRRGDRSLYTLGGRFWGKTGLWDYETELAGQWGTWAGDTIHAYSVSAYGGRTFVDCPWTPRLGAGFDYATGDDRSGDRTVGTFNQLFPLGHSWFGYLDLIGRQNVIAGNLNVTLAPAANTKLRVAYHAFWLDAEQDALYNAGGGGSRRDPFGDSGAQIGQELDVTMKVKIDRHQSLLMGWSHLFTDNYIAATGLGITDDPNLFYVQYGFRF